MERWEFEYKNAIDGGTQSYYFLFSTILQRISWTPTQLPNWTYMATKMYLDSLFNRAGRRKCALLSVVFFSSNTKCVI